MNVSTLFHSNPSNWCWSAGVANTALIGSAAQHPLASLFIVMVIWPSCSKTSPKPSCGSFPVIIDLEKNHKTSAGLCDPSGLKRSCDPYKQEDWASKTWTGTSTRKGCLNGCPYHKVRPISVTLLKLKTWYASLVEYKMSHALQFQQMRRCKEHYFIPADMVKPQILQLRLQAITILHSRNKMITLEQRWGLSVK